MTELYNLVTEGLHLDNDPLFQPKNSLRYGLNGHILHLGGNNYSWENMKGNRIAFSICEPTFTIIGWCIIRQNNYTNQRLVVFSALNYGATSDGEIGVVDFQTNGIGIYKTYYRHTALNFAISNPIECYGIYENDDIFRVYWTDRFRNAPRCLNLKLVEPIISINWVSGKTYLVNCGSVTFTVTPATYTPGSTFVFDGNLSHYTIITGTSVSVYFPYQLLDWSPQEQVGEIDHVTRITGGQLYFGTYFFSYLLGTDDGYETDWSYLAGPVPILGNNGTTYDDYQNDQANTYNISSGNGLELKINNIPVGTYNYIKICVFYSNDNNISGAGTIIAQIPITSSVVIFDYYGNENLGSILIEDLINTISVNGCKTITNIKYRAIQANLRERDELPIGNTLPATLEVAYYDMCIDQTEYFAADVDGGGTEDVALSGTRPAVGGLVVDGYIASGQWYEVMSGTVTYDGTPHVFTSPIPTYFVGTTKVNFTGGTCRPVIRIAQYYDNPNATIVYKYIPVTDYIDYKGLASSRYLKGLWGYETYRYGIACLDNYGKPYFVRWCGDLQVPIRNSNLGTGYNLVRTVTMDHGNDNLIAQIAHAKISNLDLTDIINQISGFCIVIAPRDKQVLSEGLLWATAANPVSGDTDITRPMRCQGTWWEWDVCGGASGRANYNWRRPNTYLYHCPEHLFDYDFPQLQKTDVLKITAYFDDARNNSGLIPSGGAYDIEETTNFHYATKLYDQTLPSLGKTIPAQIGDENTIFDWWKVVVYDDVMYDNPVHLLNRTNYDNDTRQYVAAGGPATLIKTINGESGVNAGECGAGFGDWNYTSSDATYYPTPTKYTVPVINHIRKKTNLYGGVGANALASTKYHFAGHYQIVDAAFRTAIETAPGSHQYIVNDLHVFGGDCFVCVFDYARLMKDNDIEDNAGSNPVKKDLGFSHCMLTPLQSNINIAMRYGHHISKDRSWENNGTIHHQTNGIGYTLADNTSIRWEDFSYNDAYSTTHLNTFPTYPFDFVNNGKFDMRQRFSEVKTPGETIDNYRRYLANNYRDADTWAGQINNVKNKKGRLYYWQDRAVGYMPINEKAMMTDPLGGQIQLGIGGTFESFEQMKDTFGNQHQWGLVETDDGFCWVDYRRKVFLHMTTEFGLTPESIKKGISSMLNNPLLYDLQNRDNNITDGISCGFDEEYKNVWIVIKLSDKREQSVYGTIIYDTLQQKFTTIFSKQPSLMISANGFFYSVLPNKYDLPLINHQYNIGDEVWDSGTNSNYICFVAFISTVAWLPHNFSGSWKYTGSPALAWQHNHSDYGKFYGVVYDSVAEMVVNDEIKTAKVFDNITMKGNDKGFNTVQYYNGTDSVVESICDQANNVVNSNYEYTKSEWWGSVALFDNEKRLQDNWLGVRLTFNNKTGTDPTISRNIKIVLSWLKTIYRKFF